MLKYKDFIAKITYIGRSGCFYGEVINKDCLIVFQAEQTQHLMEAFKTAVDQYLELNLHS
jgi:predicted HicB family RNase H-like nuclease